MSLSKHLLDLRHNSDWYWTNPLLPDRTRLQLNWLVLWFKAQFLIKVHKYSIRKSIQES